MINPLLFYHFTVLRFPPRPFKEQKVSVSVGTWANVVGIQTVLVTVSRSAWTLSPLSHKKYTVCTQTCEHTGLYSFTLSRSKTTIFLDLTHTDRSKINSNTSVSNLTQNILNVQSVQTMKNHSKTTGNTIATLYKHYSITITSLRSP